MSGSTWPFQSCILLFGGQKTPNFSAETSPQPVSTGTPFAQSCFCRWSCPFTQPQVTCLQNKGQQRKGPKLRLLYFIKSPGRFFLAVTKAVLCVCCALAEKLPAGEESGGSESSLLRGEGKGSVLAFLGVLGLSLCVFLIECFSRWIFLPDPGCPLGSWLLCPFFDPPLGPSNTAGHRRSTDQLVLGSGVGVKLQREAAGY